MKKRKHSLLVQDISKNSTNVELELTDHKLKTLARRKRLVSFKSVKVRNFSDFKVCIETVFNEAAAKVGENFRHRLPVFACLPQNRNRPKCR